MKHNIGILTFHASHNYGSMLQAYALQIYLQKLGHNVTIINLRSSSQKEMYAYPSIYSIWSVRQLAKTLLFPTIYFQNLRKWHLFESFIKYYLHTTEKEYSNCREIREALDTLGFDILISGGDQIWNQKCIDFDLSYLLPFESTGMRKISYAPSMGNNTDLMQGDPYRNRIQKYISQFDYISIREPDAAEFLSGLLSREVSVVIDPTFLLNAKDYEAIMCDRPLIRGKYLFFYTPYLSKRDRIVFSEVKKFAEAKGLNIVSTNAALWQGTIRRFNASGPLEFLNILKNAEFVCGRSFHLGVFSILFHKEFALLNGDKDARMNNLLTMCGISDRFVSMEGGQFPVFKRLDYNTIDDRVNKLREKSIEFLKRALVD